MLRACLPASPDPQPVAGEESMGEGKRLRRVRLILLALFVPLAFATAQAAEALGFPGNIVLVGSVALVYYLIEFSVLISVAEGRDPRNGLRVIPAVALSFLLTATTIALAFFGLLTLALALAEDSLGILRIIGVDKYVALQVGAVALAAAYVTNYVADRLGAAPLLAARVGTMEAFRRAWRADRRQSSRISGDFFFGLIIRGFAALVLLAVLSLRPSTLTALLAFDLVGVPIDELLVKYYVRRAKEVIQTLQPSGLESLAAQ